MITQTTYTYKPEQLTLGQYVTLMGPRTGTAALARGQIKAGYGVFKSHTVGARGYGLDALGSVFHVPNPGPDADDDAFLTTHASSGSALSITSFNGASAGATIQPSRHLTITLSAHANWDATTGTITYPDDSGKSVTETFTIPNGGDATITTTGLASGAPTALTMQAQSGTAGSFTVGLAAMTALTLDDLVGIAMRDPYKETCATNDLYRILGSATVATTSDYLDNEVVQVMQTGDAAVYCEEAMTHLDKVYVRVASGSGGSVIGAFRNDSDSGSCVVVTGARVQASTSGAGACWVRFGSF